MLNLTNILLFVIFNVSNFENDLKNYLDKNLSRYDKYEYEIIKNNIKAKGIIIDQEKDFVLSKNYGYVPVKIKLSNNQIQNSVVTLKLKLYKNVFVIKKALYADEHLKENLLEKKLIDVSQINGNVFSTDEDVNNFITKVNLKENTVLLNEHLKKIPLVNKGDKLFLHVGNNGVDISLEAISRQDGYRGDVISVQAMNKIYKAKVIDKQNLVLVN